MPDAIKRGSGPVGPEEFEQNRLINQTDKKTAGRATVQSRMNMKGRTMFAVIKSGGKQYRVAADDVVTIGNITGNPGDTIEFGEVLAFGDGDNTTIGAPLVDGAKVTAEIVEHGRAKTVIAFKKRRRQNSRRKRGQRQAHTIVRITEILAAGSKPKRKAAAKAEKAEAAEAAEA